MKQVVCVASIQEGKILLVKKIDVWILPGGKIEYGETDHECLKREIAEELPAANLTIGSYFDSFTKLTPHSRELFTARVFLGMVTESLHYSFPEISGAMYTSKPESLPLSSATKEIVYSLRSNGYL